MASRRVMRIVGWTGGEGVPPATGKYIGPLGLVDTAAEATNVRGPTGAGTGGEPTTELTAQGTIHGHRAVRASGTDHVTEADSSDTSQAGEVIGIVLTAGVDGDLVTVQYAGEIVEPTWSFSPGPVYFDASGNLTQTLPVVGFIQQIGIATTSTSIIVQIGHPILLA